MVLCEDGDGKGGIPILVPNYRIMDYRSAHNLINILVSTPVGAHELCSIHINQENRVHWLNPVVRNHNVMTLSAVGRAEFSVIVKSGVART